MNRTEIQSFLPHRDPMLLVDELTIDENHVAHGVYHVRGDEYFLQGHFPGNPIVPGVILCEMMGQSCSILLSDILKGKTPYFTGIDKVRFKQKVHPGDTVTVKGVITRNKGMFYFTKCDVFCNGNPCAQGELFFAIMEGR